MLLVLKRKELKLIHVWFVCIGCKKTFISAYTRHFRHHASMPMVTWLWFASPWLEASWFCAFENSLIHTIMYTYYLLALWGIDLDSIKPWITRLQLIQFSLGLMYSGWVRITKVPIAGIMRSLFYCRVFTYYTWAGLGCTGSTETMLISNAVNISFLWLFSGFYAKAYKSVDTKREWVLESGR